jgi:hypothetical protein
MGAHHLFNDLPCSSFPRGSTWVQQANNPALRGPFRRRDGLYVVVHRDTYVCMAHECLRGCHWKTCQPTRFPMPAPVFQRDGCVGPSRCSAISVACRLSQGWQTSNLSAGYRRDRTPRDCRAKCRGMVSTDCKMLRSLPWGSVSAMDFNSWESSTNQQRESGQP